MAEEQLRQGIALAKAGKKSQARQVLSGVVKANPRSVRAWLWLASVVTTREQQRYCLEKVLQLDPQNKAARQALSQMEPQTAGKPKVARTKAPPGAQYFAGHHLASEEMGGVQDVVDRVFSPLGYGLGRIDRRSRGQPLLLIICQKIFTAGFGVFDLSTGDSNEYLELGIALGFNRPIVAVARKGASLPKVLQGYDVLWYADRSDLGAELSRLCDQGFPPTTRPARDHCYFCGRVCPSMSTPPEERSYLVLHHSKLLWRNLMRSLEPHLAKYDLRPGYLIGRASETTLCDVRRQVLASQFALSHLGALSDESSFLALGMAIGSRVPWVLLSSKSLGSVPADLQGSDRIDYTTLADLEGRLTDTLGVFLSGVMTGSVSTGGRTTVLSLPFWLQLQDWISRVTRTSQAQQAVQGEIQVAHYVGQECLARHGIPERGLLIGRNPDCNVVVESQGVSARHFRILKGRTGRCFVEDLQSRNGTFLNGVRLSPVERAELHLKDTIRIPGARFLIWDDRPLPEEAPQASDDTGMLPPIPRIEIPDVPPPTYLSTWDHSLILTVLLPDGRTRSLVEVQAYYPMGRILSELVDLLDLPRGRYRFRIGEKFIGDDETPLSIGIQRGMLLIMVPE